LSGAPMRRSSAGFARGPIVIGRVMAPLDHVLDYAARGWTAQRTAPLPRVRKEAARGRFGQVAWAELVSGGVSLPRRFPPRAGDARDAPSHSSAQPVNIYMLKFRKPG
jgi:hypothetical protein